ncbi:MAG: Branched-chain amino acid transport system permease protein LivM, partial [uncultured Thermomicrobiales bacterium]
GFCPQRPAGRDRVSAPRSSAGTRRRCPRPHSVGGVPCLRRCVVQRLSPPDRHARGDQRDDRRRVDVDQRLHRRLLPRPDRLLGDRRLRRGPPQPRAAVEVGDVPAGAARVARRLRHDGLAPPGSAALRLPGRGDRRGHGRDTGRHAADAPLGPLRRGGNDGFSDHRPLGGQQLVGGYPRCPRAIADSELYQRLGGLWLRARGYLRGLAVARVPLRPGDDRLPREPDCRTRGRRQRPPFPDDRVRRWRVPDRRRRAAARAPDRQRRPVRLLLHDDLQRRHHGRPGGDGQHQRRGAGRGDHDARPGVPAGGRGRHGPWPTLVRRALRPVADHPRDRLHPRHDLSSAGILRRPGTRPRPAPATWSPPGRRRGRGDADARAGARRRPRGRSEPL